MLLEYLANDAQAAGLSTEWRLSSFVGFIVSLCLACVIGFQAPLITLLSLQSGAVDRPTLVAYRRHIWFITFVLGAAFSPPDPLSLFLVSMPISVGGDSHGTENRPSPGKICAPIKHLHPCFRP